jgi:agmatine deiminase
VVWTLRIFATVVLAAVLALLSMSGAAARSDSPARAAALSRVLPAEFESVSELMVTWPDDEHLAAFVGEVVAEASSAADVVIAFNQVVDRTAIEEKLSELGVDLGSIRFLSIDYTSMWIRDYGPLRVRTTSGHSIVEFEYFGENNDDRLARAVARSLWSTTSTELPIEFEGGNLLSNGAGTCLTTTALLDQNRAISERRLRAMFRVRLGCKHLLILPRLAREGTGHVDMFASFVSARRVLLGSFDPADDRENARLLDRSEAMLEQAGFEVIRIPMGNNEDGVFRTYTNTAVINNLVLVPVYRDDREKEREAIEIIRAVYPKRDVIAIDASEAIELGGAIHCITMTLVD